MIYVPKSRKLKIEKPPLLEADIQRTVTEFMIAKGWRHLRTDPGSDIATVREIRKRVSAMVTLKPYLALIFAILNDCSRGKGFGEVGMPDSLFIRYRPKVMANTYGQVELEALREELGDCDAQFLWIEYKKPGKKPEPHQKRWHEKERKLGALVKVVDDIDEFMRWYEDAWYEEARP